MQISELEVLIQANADQFRREVGDVKAQLGSMSKTASSSTASAGASMVKMGAVAGAVGAIVAKGVDVALRAFKQLAIGTTKMAMEAVESESLVAVVFGDMVGEITDWSNEMSEALGLNAYQVRRSAGVFYNIADAMGLSSENAMTLSKGIVSLSNDMASFYNLSTDEAVTKLRAGITGETEPLKQLGIIVDENTIKQTAYRVGIAQVGQELSNQQKVLARYMTIMEQTSTAQGDLARTLDSPANQLRVLKARWEQLSITIGAIFIPVLNAILPYIQAFITLVGEAVKAIGKLFGIVGIKAVGTAQKLTTGFEDVGTSSNVAAKGVKALKKELAGLASFDEMNVLKVPEANGSGGSGGGGGVGGGIDFVLPEYDTGIDNIKNKAKELADTIRTFFEGIWETLKEILEPAMELWDIWVAPAFEGLVAQVKMLGKTISESPIGAFIIEVGKTIGEILGVVVVGVIGAVVYALTGLLAIWEGSVKLVDWVFENIIDTIAMFVAMFRRDTDSMARLFIDMWNRLPAPVQKVIVGISTWIADMINKIKTSWVLLKEGIVIIWEDIKKKVVGIVVGMIDSVISKVNGLKSVFSTLAGAILNVIKVPLNGLITLLNNFIRSVNKIKIPDWVPAIGGRGFNIPTISYLAEGGVVSSPTLAVMGEGGYKEAVLPLDRNTGWAKEVADLINQNGSGKGINLVVKIGEDTIYDKAIDYINNKSLRTGMTILNI